MSKLRTLFILLISISALFCIVVAGIRYIPWSHPLCKDCDVILISIDTFGAKHISLYNSDLDTTPYLAELAKKRGVVFDHAYAQAPWTLPSHAAMFTGHYPWELGMIQSSDALPESATTIAEVLKHEGYTTAAFSNGVFVNPLWQMTQGFDSFTGSMLESDWNDLPDLFIQGAQFAKSNKAENQKKPFFLLLRPFMTHDPYGQAPDPDAITMTDIISANAHIQSSSTPEAKRFTTAYHEEIRLTDAALKTFVEGLEESGALSHTILIITSDHGEEFGEHGTVGAHAMTINREALWVPLVIIAPGISPGRISASVETRSIPATIAELTGADGSTFSGASLVPYLTRKETTDRFVLSQTAITRDSFFSSVGDIYANPHFFGEVVKPTERTGPVPKFTQSIIKGKWHLIRPSDGSNDRLYDMERDPEEHTDLFPQFSALTAEVQGQIQEMILQLVVS